MSQENISKPSGERLEQLINRAENEVRKGVIPVDLFGNQEVFDAEMERIFARSWVFLGFESEIPKSGDFVQRKIGRDRVIVTRDSKGGVNVLANFCRHRGTKICYTDKGNASHFRCPYHGWVYKNTGDWIGAPDKTAAYDGIDQKEWGLLKAPKVESYLGMIFACLDKDGPTLQAFLGGAAWMMRGLMDLHPAGMSVVAPPDRYNVRGDWKTGAENFAGDIYHVAVAHNSASLVHIAPDFSGLNLLATNYIFENGHAFLGHNFDEMFGEQGHLWFYDPSIKSRFDLNRLDDTLRDVVLKNPPIVGTIFPNLSFLRFFGEPSPGKPLAVYTSWRQWQPVGPGRMELWSWQLKWDCQTAEEAEASYATGQFGFGSAGMFEQDDTVVWEGPPEAARSVWARKEKASLNIQMGQDGIGHQGRDENWTGPGQVFRPGPGEPHARNFYTHWVEMMKGDGK